MRSFSQAGKVCFTVATTSGYPPRVGGLAIAAHRICHYLADAGFEVHVVTYAAEESSVHAVEDGITVHRVSPGKTDLERIFNLQHYLRKLDDQEDFDLFHGFFLPSVPPSMATARAKQRKRLRKVIASVRGSDLHANLNHPYTRPLLLSALRDPNCWVTSVNQTYLDQLAAEADITGRSSVMRNGAPKLIRNWKPAEENFGVVGSSGMFRKVKDIPLLVRGFRDIRPELRRRLLLVGAFADASEEAWSRTLCEEGNVQDQVEITGALSHSQALLAYNRMHVYVQTSTFEGMPNTLLEAAAVGVPIVATAANGVTEIFTNEKDALLVPHTDFRGLTRAIERVIESPQLAASLADRAVELAEVYSSERERTAWVRLHLDLLQTKEQRTPLSDAPGVQARYEIA